MTPAVRDLAARAIYETMKDVMAVEGPLLEAGWEDHTDAPGSIRDRLNHLVGQLEEFLCPR